MKLVMSCIVVFCLLSLFPASLGLAMLNLTLPIAHPNPEQVVQDLQRRVNASIFSRRKLLQVDQSTCFTGNPIDDCWKCDPNWPNDRQRLADCAIGFGQHALGGKGGEYYIVTDSSDHDAVNPKPGTLRYAVIQPQPLWIVFPSNMMIKLSQELIFNSFKTLDGRGANVHIVGGGCITLQCRRGYIHVVNNEYSEWEMYAIGGSGNPTINSQGNRYYAPQNPFAKEVTKRVETAEGDGGWKDWNWRSEGDIMVNGAFFVASGQGVEVKYEKAYSVEPKSAANIAELTMHAGPLGVGGRDNNLGMWSTGLNGGGNGLSSGDDYTDDMAGSDSLVSLTFGTVFLSLLMGLSFLFITLASMSS
ncbi:hypothetical protein ACFE04_001038 [Oxalis oulophora]